MAPGLVGKEKSERGKLPTDTWWHTIVPTKQQRKNRLPDTKTIRNPALELSVHPPIREILF